MAGESPQACGSKSSVRRDTPERRLHCRRYAGDDARETAGSRRCGLGLRDGADNCRPEGRTLWHGPRRGGRGRGRGGEANKRDGTGEKEERAQRGGSDGDVSAGVRFVYEVVHDHDNNFSQNPTRIIIMTRAKRETGLTQVHDELRTVGLCRRNRLHNSPIWQGTWKSCSAAHAVLRPLHDRYRYCAWFQEMHIAPTRCSSVRDELAEKSKPEREQRLARASIRRSWKCEQCLSFGACICRVRVVCWRNSICNRAV